MKNCLLRGLLGVLLLAVFADAQKKPEINVSPNRVKAGGAVTVLGTNFTANRTVMSHLRRPNGTEYNPLRLRADQNGEVYHKIDTSMLDVGAFELWIEDEASGVVSNRAQFTVE
jgi:hypothetical protein